MKINPVLFCISPSLYYLCSDMANDYFQFRQFTIRQERCGMKVGTDGTQLGAWAQGGKRILDIGTGTGLIVLMMAQRFPEAEVVGIDIDADAVAQARENVAASPFSRRVDILLKDVKDMEGTFDSIVSNPPYFSSSLHSPDDQRSLARHDDALPCRLLMERCRLLLDDDGELSVVMPIDCKGTLEGEAALAGFFKCREWTVRTSARKAPKRCLLAFRKHPSTLEREELLLGSEQCHEMTKDFYL